MTRTVTIDPVTRIEGHAKITLYLGDDGKVADARFHVVEFRGFEKFCVGRSFWEMPGITARVCGICPVSHILASAKAGDNILGVRVPPRAEKLRRLMNWGQLVQSHALSFFHLSAPDLLLGMDSDPATRNIMGLIQNNPSVARSGIRLRQFGQEVIRLLGGKSVHPAWAVAGGVRDPLTAEDRNQIKRMLPEAFDIAELALDLLKDSYDKFESETPVYGDFPSLFMGLVTPDGGLEHYDGLLRVVDEDGRVLENVNPSDFRRFVGEAVEPWTYLKFPYYKPLGYPQGMYRVGPLARLNVCDFAGTPRADRELRQFRRYGQRGKPVTGSFHYHYARLIEILFSLERIEETLADESLLGTHVRSISDVNESRGIGVSEAPRGTLFHEYEVDGNGILQKVNMIIATGQNNLAMNRTVQQLARAYVNGDGLSEGVLNRIEHGIRLYDPCLSCSTHAVGQMPMHVQLRAPDGALVQEIIRD
ncbi:MAG: Ni/Fe hydrogenase subunit alpha [Caldilineae bacterium]|nr:Ni/Fe hydrogenase subunit alpha [Anaerolineae bacterium]MCB9154764.1 Ni/Fe hydrogenase subunit alpha [Caldilineae bacterium]